MNLHTVFSGLVICQVAAPALALAAVGLPALVGRAPSERFTFRAVGSGFGVAFVAALITLTALAVRGFRPEEVHLGSWFSVGHHDATIDLVADALSIPYVCFSAGLCLLVNLFALKYLHREPGFTRFFLLLALFGLGMNLMVLAGSIDVMFAGWEFVGVSSTLLIGFFLERRNAAQAALRAFTTYRICDVGLLAASVVIHRAVGSGDFERLFGVDWPYGTCLVPLETARIVSLLLVFAALGKTAQLPFSGWLPRAMEGPTPSSAIFYGALSIHAGAYILLRCEALLEQTPMARAALIVIGTGTALHASLIGRVQTDLKSSLAYASMTQASLILVEIGLGWRMIPLFHVISHAVLRSLQILRSPSALHDRHELEAALGGHPGPASRPASRWVPQRWSAAAYRVALDRGYEEMLVGKLFVGPVQKIIGFAASIERSWIAWLGGDFPGGRT